MAHTSIVSQFARFLCIKSRHKLAKANYAYCVCYLSFCGFDIQYVSNLCRSLICRQFEFSSFGENEKSTVLGSFKLPTLICNIEGLNYYKTGHDAN